MPHKQKIVIHIVTIYFDNEPVVHVYKGEIG